MSSDRDLLRGIALSASAFAARHIEPSRAKTDHDGLSFPDAIFRLGAGAGFDRMVLPEDLGGHGLGLPELCALVKSLSHTCAGHAMVFGVHLACLKSILDSAADGRKTLSIITAAHGAPVAPVIPEIVSLSTFDTGATAERTGDGYIFNGRPGLLAGASGGGFAVCFARTPGGSPVAALVPIGGDGGVAPPAPEPSLGLRALPLAALSLDRFTVSGSLIIAEKEGAESFFRSLMVNLCIVSAAASAGVAARAASIAAGYAAERYQGGRIIIDHTHLRTILGSISARAAAAEAISDKAAEGGPSPAEALSAKITATGSAVRACTDAVQILGGYGYMREFGAEKLMRDAASLSLFPFSNTQAELMLAELEK